jgi:hypothetical protein
VINYRGVDHVIGDGASGPRATELRKVLNEIQLQQRPDPWGWVLELED